MKKSLTYTAQNPITRNEFIDFLNKKENVIVLNRDLWCELHEEVDNIILAAIQVDNFSASENILSLFNPVLLAFNVFFKTMDAINSTLYDFKKYDVYLGKDVNDEEIIILLFSIPNEVKFKTLK